MNAALLLALLGRKPELKTETITASKTWTAPAGLAVVDVSGYGARGTNSSTRTVKRYYKTSTIYATRRSDGGTDTFSGGTSIHDGNVPANYCDPFVSSPTDPKYSGNQTCYTHSDASYTETVPATTGASATAFGKTFPGSTGNVPQTTTTFTGVPVTGGANYSIVVPTGGVVQISYYV